MHGKRHCAFRCVQLPLHVNVREAGAMQPLVEKRNQGGSGGFFECDAHIFCGRGTVAIGLLIVANALKERLIANVAA